VAQPPDEADAAGEAEVVVAARLPEAESLLLALCVVEALSVAMADAAAPVAGAGAAVPPEPPLKSVTYQPEPLSWKPAAVSCLEKVGLPHSGQSVNGSSAILCKTSLAWPQDPHL